MLVSERASGLRDGARACDNCVAPNHLASEWSLCACVPCVGGAYSRVLAMAQSATIRAASAIIVEREYKKRRTTNKAKFQLRPQLNFISSQNDP